MVKTKKMILEVQIEIDIPIDIVQDSHIIKAVEIGQPQYFKGPIRSRSFI
jgi:hypothetical protein